MSAMHNPAHPGEVLREYLPEGLSIGKIAKRLGITRQALSAVLNGRAGVSAAMALRLEVAFLRELMNQHGLTQKDLPEIGAQSVVSAVLSGKRRF